jgi:formiminotetrahydrofolate cyclodeaminase
MNEKLSIGVLLHFALRFAFIVLRSSFCVHRFAFTVLLTLSCPWPRTLIMHDRTNSIEQFLSATAAKQPTPGGGSVAALAGALAAAIGEMVLSYSLGKKDLVAFEPELKQAAHELQLAREMLLQLMVEDQEAYAELTAARKLPVDSADRQGRITAAVIACIRVPQAIGASAVSILLLCDRIVEKVNPWLLSDLAVCCDLATATARCASYNVRVNLNSVEDTHVRRDCQIEIEKILAHAIELIQRVSPKIWQKSNAV